MNYFFRYIIALGCLFPILSFGQVEYLEGKFLNYKSIDGLEPEGAYAIEQDSIGKIWIGTADGLYSFDGKKINREDLGNITTKNKFLVIEDLIADGQHRLWIGSNQGLWMRDSSLNYSQLLSETEFVGKKISTLFISPDKKYLFAGIFISKKPDVLVKVNLENLQSEIFNQDDFPNVITTIWQKKSDNILWLGGEQLFQFNFQNKQLQKIPSPFPSLNIEDIDSYNNHILISSWGKGIFLFDPKLKQWGNQFTTTYGGNSIRNLVQKNDTTFYVACADKGFGEFYPESGIYSFYKHSTTDPTSIPIRSGRKIFVDRDQNIWIAMDRALSFYNQRMRSVNFHPIPEEIDMTKTKVADMASSQDGQINVLGFTNHDFLFFDKDFKLIKDIKLQKDKSMTKQGAINLIAGNYNNIFANSKSKGLIEVDLNNYTSRLVFSMDTLSLEGKNKTLNSCRKAPDGTIWLTTFNKAVIKYDDRSRKVDVIKIEEDSTKSYSTYEVGFTGGKTFVSSKVGLHQIVNDKAIHVDIPIDIESNYMFSIFGLNDSTLAIGTSIKGLYLYNHLNDSLTHISMVKGSANIDVQELELDQEGSLWGISSKGIFALPKGKVTPVFFSTIDGLKENRVGRFFIDVLPDGRMMVSTRTGFNIFDPKKMISHLKPKSIQISKINEFSFYKNPTQISLAPDRPYLNLKFGDYNFEPSSRAKYFYKLLPQQTDWQEIPGDNQLSFPQLASGNYTLQLKSKNRWHESSPITSLEIEVKSHFWKRPSFIFFSMLLFTGLVAFITTLFTRRKEREKALRDTYEKEINQMELRALRAHMNPHFLFNSLNSIRFFIQKNDNKSANSYISKFSKLLRFILNHSNKNTVTLTEELEALQLYLEFEKLRFDDRFSYEIKVAEDIDTDKINIQPLLLQPIIENAIWHGIMKADESGEILINVFEVENQTHIIIEDDGVGIDFTQLNNYKKERVGLNIVEKRIELFNAKNILQIEYETSNINPNHPTRKGTRVSMKIFEKNDAS